MPDPSAENIAEITKALNQSSGGKAFVQKYLGDLLDRDRPDSEA